MDKYIHHIRLNKPDSDPISADSSVYECVFGEIAASGAYRARPAVASGIPGAIRQATAKPRKAFPRIHRLPYHFVLEECQQPDVDERDWLKDELVMRDGKRHVVFFPAREKARPRDFPWKR